MTNQAPKRRVATSPRMSEQQLLDAVVDLAHARNWLVFHPRPLRRADGSWRTGTQGDRGFPDLTLARPESIDALMRYQFDLSIGLNAVKPVPQMLFVELKSDRGVVSPEQQAWLTALSPFSAVWRPAQWRDGTIERSLR